MVEPTAMSITPWRSAANSRVWSPWISDTPGYSLMSVSYTHLDVYKRQVPGTIVPNGAKVPGTQFQLDPVQAAFNIGTLIRWLDFNDCWLAAEWGHPSDNLGGILAVADWLSRKAVAAGKPALTMADVLTACIKAHEIEGCLALENAFNLSRIHI